MATRRTQATDAEITQATDAAVTDGPAPGESAGEATPLTLVTFVRDVYESGHLKHAAGGTEALPDVYAAKVIRLKYATPAS